jgi:hypothetical protein
MHCFYHAQVSVKLFGGIADDYQAIHNWFDESKSILADFRHRALRHHAEGIWMLEKVFGVTITNSDGRQVPVRLIGEQHVKDDLGFIPSFADWARQITPLHWMRRANHPVSLTQDATFLPS